MQQPHLVKGFLNATQRGAAFTTEQPDKAWELFCQQKPALRTPLFRSIFTHTLPFFSRNLLNVERDWNKVGRYAKHLGVIDDTFDIGSCYTNNLLPDIPYSDIKAIACCIE